MFGAQFWLYKNVYELDLNEGSTSWDSRSSFHIHKDMFLC